MLPRLDALMLSSRSHGGGTYHMGTYGIWQVKESRTLRAGLGGSRSTSVEGFSECFWWRVSSRLPAGCPEAGTLVSRVVGGRKCPKRPVMVVRRPASMEEAARMQQPLP